VLIERAPHLAYRGIDRALRIDEDLFSPDPLVNFVAGKQSSGFLDQQKEELKGEGLKRHNTAVVAQLVGNSIKLEVAESHDVCRHLRLITSVR
jgi:hypothetical protein